MAHPTSARICTTSSESIGRQYVNNRSHINSLLNDNTESDVLQLLDLLERTRKNWQNCEAELKDVRKKWQLCEARLVELKDINDKYEQCKGQLDELMDVRVKYEQCKAELDEVKRRWKPMSTNAKILSPPPLAILEEDEIEAESEIETKEDDEESMDDEASTSKITDTPKASYRMRRSMSVPFVNKSRGSTSSEDGNGCTSKNTSFGSPPRPGSISPTSPRPINISPTTPNFVRLTQIESRPHVFDRKRIFTKTVCHICTSNIRFGIEAIKCQACKLHCHQHCSRRAPTLCIPWCAPPKVINGRIRLGDYCASNVVPKLPHLIVRCVHYLNTEKLSRGLYTNLDYSSEADLLLQLILHERIPPELKGYGPQATAHCLMKFLADIRESLIPESSFKEFCDATKKPDNFEIEAAVSELPIVHRNALAYLFIHWKLLNEHSEVNGLTADVLSRALIPVIMRGTNTNLPPYLPIFSRLLLLTNSFWEGIIEEGIKYFAKTPISRTSSKKMQVDVSRSITVAKLTQAGSIRRC